MRYGLTIPFDSVRLGDHDALYDAAWDAGFTHLWSSEVNGSDAFTPLVRAATRQPFSLGTAIVPAFTRSPGLLAMTAASLADSSDGQVYLGVGSSSNVIVERWNGVPFEDPYGRVRDVIEFLNRAFDGERVSMDAASFTVDGFRLARVPSRRPRLLVAALRPGMLKLAGSTSDGVILNWLAPHDVETVVQIVAGAHPQGQPEVVARLFVIPSIDRDVVESVARPLITAYLNVPVYAEFHRWLGRAPQLQPMWDAWSNGDRSEALKQVPRELIDELFIHGSPAECARQVDEYVASGVTVPVLSFMTLLEDPLSTIEAFARN